MNESALEARDRTLVEILRTVHPAAEAHVPAASELQARARELGVRIGLAEILLGQGHLPQNAFVAACQAAAQRKVGLVDRSSMRHLQVKPDEDEQVAQVAVNYGFLAERALVEARSLRDSISALGVPVLLSKVLADRSVLDVEVYEGLLHYLRRFQAQSLGKAPPAAQCPFDEEDLAIGLAGLETGRLTKVQIERSLKIKSRFRKAGIERNAAEILFEQGALDAPGVSEIARAASERLNPPRPIRLELRRFTPQQIEALGRELQGNRLAAPAHMPRALEAQKRLAESAIDRPLALVLVDLGLAKKEALERIFASSAPPTPTPPPLPAVKAAPGPARPLRAPDPEAVAPTVIAPAVQVPPTVVHRPGAPGRASGQRGRRTTRGSASGARPGRTGANGPIIVAVVGGLAFLGTLAAFLVLRGGDPEAVPVEKPAPAAGGADQEPADEAIEEGAYLASLARIDRAIDARDYREALELATALADRLGANAAWKAQVASRRERADQLRIFHLALVEAVNGRVPFRGEGSWKKLELLGADESVLQVKKDGSGTTAIMRWEKVSPKGLLALARELEVDREAPLPTLHFLIHYSLDEPARGHGARLLANEPNLKDQVQGLMASYLGVPDGARDLVVEGGYVLTRAEQEAGKRFGETAGTPEPEPGPEEGPDPGAEDPEDPERAGLVQYGGRWITPEEKEALENEAKGLVLYQGRWILRAERDRLEAEAEGLVLFEGRWITPEEKEALEKEREGLVFDEEKGQWVKVDDRDRRQREAEGLVLHKGKWVTPEEKQRLVEAERKEREGKVYFRGRWISVKEQAIFEDVVQDPKPEQIHVSSNGGCQIAIPDSGRWSFQAGAASGGAGGDPVFSIRKTVEGRDAVTMSCLQFIFRSNFTATGRGWEETVGGDNPSGLLRIHRRLYEEKRGGAIVRVKMQKDFFHKDMHAFWCHLDYRDGTTVKIYSVASNLKIANRGYVVIVEFAKDQFEVSGLGVDSMLKTFNLTGQ